MRATRQSAGLQDYDAMHAMYTCAAVHIHDLDGHGCAVVPALKDMPKAALAQLPDQ